MVIYEISRFPFPSDAVLSGVIQTENINGNIWKKFYIKGEFFEQKCFVLNWNEMFHKDKTIYTNGQIVEICYVEDEDEYYESGKVIVMITLLESE